MLGVACLRVGVPQRKAWTLADLGLFGVSLVHLNLALPDLMRELSL